MVLAVQYALKRTCPAVSRHAALWRPDFPLYFKQEAQRLPVPRISPLSMTRKGSGEYEKS